MTFPTNIQFQVVRYTPAGHRFPWCAPVATWDEANALAVRSRMAAYSAALDLGGDAAREPIRIVVESIGCDNDQHVDAVECAMGDCGAQS